MKKGKKYKKYEKGSSIFSRKVMFFSLCAFLMMFLSSVSYAIPKYISLQGRLTDSSSVPLTGTYYMNFSLYNNETAGNLLWNESKNIAVENGVFSTVLGDVVALDVAFDNDYWLQTEINGETLTPRARVTSAGYAYTAYKLIGVDNVFPSSGNIGIGIANPSMKLDVNGNDGSTFARFKTSTGGNGITFEDISGDKKIAIRNSSGATAIFLSSNSDSFFSGNVGVGTTNPSQKLEVDGNMMINNTAASGTMFINSISGGDSQIIFQEADSYMYRIAHDGSANKLSITNGTVAGSGDLMTIDGATGNVGVGMTSPQAKLDVNGSVKAKGLKLNSTGYSYINSYSNNGMVIGSSSQNSNFLVYVNDTQRPALWIDSQRQVGIGMPKGVPPNARLDVRDTISDNADIMSYHNGGVYSYMKMVPYGLKSRFYMSFITDDAGTPTERMRITQSGNVGIGTASPGTTLDVNGSISLGSSSPQANKVLCWRSDNSIGYCSSQPDANGACTCNAIS